MSAESKKPYRHWPTALPKEASPPPNPDSLAIPDWWPFSAHHRAACTTPYVLETWSDSLGSALHRLARFSNSLCTATGNLDKFRV